MMAGCHAILSATAVLMRMPAFDRQRDNSARFVKSRKAAFLYDQIDNIREKESGSSILFTQNNTNLPIGRLTLKGDAFDNLWSIVNTCPKASRSRRREPRPAIRTLVAEMVRDNP